MTVSGEPLMMDQMKSNNFESVGPIPPYRMPGMAPGDYIDVVRAEIERALKEAGREKVESESKE